MKIYIVGTVGSGKSTLARKLSGKSSIDVFHLDSVVHDGERHRTDKEISESIECIFKNNDFIIEDTLREQFIPLLSKVDKIIYLDLPKTLLKYRVIKRYLKQKIGLEKSTYRQSLQMLRQMFIWQKIDRSELIKAQKKTIILKNQREIRQFIKKFSKIEKKE